MATTTTTTTTTTITTTTTTTTRELENTNMFEVLNFREHHDHAVT